VDRSLRETGSVLPK
ncbi:hypothetical protein JTB14_030275, partial [Gonioctena quinquepunctata]